MPIMIEKEMHLDDLAETIAAQLQPNDVLAFLEKLSTAMSNEPFDQQAAELFADIAQRWS